MRRAVTVSVATIVMALGIGVAVALAQFGSTENAADDQYTVTTTVTTTTPTTTTPTDTTPGVTVTASVTVSTPIVTITANPGITVAGEGGNQPGGAGDPGASRGDDDEDGQGVAPEGIDESPSGGGDPGAGVGPDSTRETGGTSKGSLPFTGAPLLWLVLLALVLLTTGLIARAMSRRDETG